VISKPQSSETGCFRAHLENKQNPNGTVFGTRTFAGAHFQRTVVGNRRGYVFMGLVAAFFAVFTTRGIAVDIFWPFKWRLVLSELSPRRN